MKHLNGNKMCSVAIRTSGIYPGYHELLEISVVACNWHLEVDKTIMPLNLIMYPMKIENYSPKENKDHRVFDSNIDHRIFNVSISKMGYHVRTGMEYGKAIDLFVNWFQQLKLPSKKKIVPLSYDWLTVAQFIQDWAGIKTFNEIFDDRYRDIKSDALLINDRAGYRNSITYPFAKTNLMYILNKCRATPDEKNDSLADAISMINCYRVLCRYMF